MRRDAGRTFEIQIWFAGACLLSLVAGAAWKPWGYLAGPTLLVVAVAGAVIGFARSERRTRRTQEALLAFAANPAAAPPPAQLRDLVYGASTSDPAHRAAFLRAARDPSHPAREAFCALCLRLDYKDPDALQAAAAYLLERPEADPAWDLAGDVVSRAVPPLAERVARAVLTRGVERTARSAARALVYRGAATWEPGHEQFADLVRELKDRIEPRLQDLEARGQFKKLVP